MTAEKTTTSDDEHKPGAATAKAAPLLAGDEVRLELHAMLPSGEAVGNYEQVHKHEIRVSGAFVGEEVTARVEHVGKHQTFATALQVERGRMGRRMPPCPNHVDRGGKCTGCPMMPAQESDQRTMLAGMLKSSYGLEVSGIEEAPKPLGYRMSAKRVAFGGRGRLRLGSYRKGTNKPADMEGCLVDHPKIAAAADDLAEVCRGLDIPAHFEDPNKDEAEYGLHSVWLRTDGEKVLVTLVASNEDAENDALRIATRAEKIDGFALSMTEVVGSSLRGTEPKHLFGIDSLTVRGQRIGPMAFLQPNPAVAAQVYERLCRSSESDQGGLAYDLYAGSGATTARLLKGGWRVEAAESSAESVSALSEVLGEELTPESVGDFLTRKLEAPSGETPALVIANPPRRGLGEKVCESLLALKAPELRIMACGPAGLAKDLKRLESRYTLTSLTAYATLPQTTHVELLAELQLKE